MTTVKKAELRKTLGGLLREEAARALASGTTTRPALLKEAVKSIREKHGAGAPLTVNDVVNYEMARTMKVVGQVNQPAGKRGNTTISHAEVDRVAAQDPVVGAPVMKAFQAIVTRGIPVTGAALAADVGKLLPGVMTSGMYGNEGDGPVRVAYLPGPGLRCGTREAMAKALGIESDDLKRDIPRFSKASRPVADTESFYEFFVQSNSYSPEAEANAKKLVALFKKNFSEMYVGVFGRDNDAYSSRDPVAVKLGVPAGEDCSHPFFVVGRTGDGALVGLRSDLVWT